jgi:hypothetical protein
MSLQNYYCSHLDWSSFSLTKAFIKKEASVSARLLLLVLSPVLVRSPFKKRISPRLLLQSGRFSGVGLPSKGDAIKCIPCERCGK